MLVSYSVGGRGDVRRWNRENGRVARVCAVSCQMRVPSPNLSSAASSGSLEAIRRDECQAGLWCAWWETPQGDRPGREVGTDWIPRFLIFEGGMADSRERTRREGVDGGEGVCVRVCVCANDAWRDGRGGWLESCLSTSRPARH